MGAYLEAARDDDYIGVQTYFTQHLGPDLQDLPRDQRTGASPRWAGHSPRGAGPHGAARVCRGGRAGIVTENGVASDDDAERIEYYSRSLAALREAMDDGVDVRGFFAWSLLDNSSGRRATAQVRPGGRGPRHVRAHTQALCHVVAPRPVSSPIAAGSLRAAGRAARSGEDAAGE